MYLYIFDFTLPLHLYSYLSSQVELSGTPSIKLLLGIWLSSFFLVSVYSWEEKEYLKFKVE